MDPDEKQEAVREEEIPMIMRHGSEDGHRESRAASEDGGMPRPGVDDQLKKTRTKKKGERSQ